MMRAAAASAFLFTFDDLLVFEAEAGGLIDGHTKRIGCGESGRKLVVSGGQNRTAKNESAFLLTMSIFDTQETAFCCLLDDKQGICQRVRRRQKILKRIESDRRVGHSPSTSASATKLTARASLFELVDQPHQLQPRLIEAGPDQVFSDVWTDRILFSNGFSVQSTIWPPWVPWAQGHKSPVGHSLRAGLF